MVPLRPPRWGRFVKQNLMGSADCEPTSVLCRASPRALSTSEVRLQLRSAWSRFFCYFGKRLLSDFPKAAIANEGRFGPHVRAAKTVRAATIQRAARLRGARGLAP